MFKKSLAAILLATAAVAASFTSSAFATNLGPAVFTTFKPAVEEVVNPPEATLTHPAPAYTFTLSKIETSAVLGVDLGGNSGAGVRVSAIPNGDGIDSGGVAVLGENPSSAPSKIYMQPSIGSGAKSGVYYVEADKRPKSTMIAAVAYQPGK